MSGRTEEEPRPNLRSRMTRLSPSWLDSTYNCTKEDTSDMPQGRGNCPNRNATRGPKMYEIHKDNNNLAVVASHCRQLGEWTASQWENNNDGAAGG